MVELQLPSNLEYIAGELYDASRIGVLSIPHAIPVGFRTKLLEQLRDAPFERAPPLYKNTVQDFFRFSHETHTLETLPESLGAITELAAAHERFYQEFGKTAGFEDALKITYNVHRYPGGSKGLGAHRDESKYRNLIAIYVLSGERQFVAGRERTLETREFIFNSPGSVILMRAPRNDSEKQLRPYHAVCNVSSPSTIISFRHEVTNGQNTHQ